MTSPARRSWPIPAHPSPLPKSSRCASTSTSCAPRGREARPEVPPVDPLRRTQHDYRFPIPGTSVCPIASTASCRRSPSDSRIPAVSIAVASPERVLYAGAVGYADLRRRRLATAEDQYPWFSMTKIATATAAMRLHADGRPRPRRPHRHLPARYRPHPGHGHPTTRQLLTHTAGLGNPLPMRWVRPEDQPADPTGSRASSTSTAPPQAGRCTGRLLQHRLPAGGRRHAGSHRALGRGVRPRRRPEPAGHDRDRLPLRP